MSGTIYAQRKGWVCKQSASHVIRHKLKKLGYKLKPEAGHKLNMWVEGWMQQHGIEPKHHWTVGEVMRVYKIYPRKCMEQAINEICAAWKI